MIKRLTSASICLALASVASADTGAKDDSKQDAVAAETASGLDAFVDSAIRSGLLVPNEEYADADGDRSVDRATLERLGVDCRSEYELDFTVVRSLRRFSDLPSNAAEDGTDMNAKMIEDLKSKIALGLYAEAKALISRAPETEWVAYRKIIALMENRERPDLEYFRALNSCFEDAGLWNAAAQLVVFDPEGPELLAQHLADVRGLPFTLREDLATLVIPSLLIERRGDLGQQILSTFTPQDIEKSTRLSALKTAIADMPTGSESDDRLVMLMSRPQLKLAALLILVERDEQLRPTLHSFVLEEAWNVLEESETQHDLDPILAFVIKHLGSEDLYSGLTRVRALGVADRVDVRASIDNHTMIALESYLGDNSSKDAINALQTLNLFHAQLPTNERGNELRKQGAKRAIELGLFSMVKRFLEPVDRTPQVGLLLAQAAYWGHVNEDLFNVREEFPKEIEINRMAGLRALEANAPAVALAAYSALVKEPSMQLELLEQGAVESNWVLWNSDLSELVAGLTDPEVERLARVRTIYRAGQNEPTTSPRKLKPYQIADLLKSSRQTLSRQQAGANNDQ